MAFVTENERVNSKISKFNIVLKELLIDSDSNNIESIFQRLGILDDKVQPTRYLQSHHPEWIGFTALHFAAHHGYEIGYEVLLDLTADFTIQNEEGATPLHIAIESNSPGSQGITPDFFIDSTLLAHIKYKTFKNPYNKNGLSHFHIACLTNKVELVKKFLDHGVPIDYKVNQKSTVSPGYTGLHFAVEYRHLEVIKVLLSHGADTQIKDAKGMTPLHKLLKSNLNIADPASAEKYTFNDSDEASEDELIFEWASEPTEEKFIKQELVEMIKLFLTHHNQDCIGLSQLHLACMIRDLDETERLIRIAIDINHQVDMNSSYWPGYAALHFAARVDFDIVKLLLKHGANIEAKDVSGVTPFDICLKRYKPSEIHTIISLVPEWEKIVLSDGEIRLLDVIFALADADRLNKFIRRLLKNLHVYVPNDSPLWPGFSLMHLAVALGEIEADRSILLKIRAPTLLQQQEVHGWTPLHLAYRLQKDNVAELLIKRHLTLANFADIVDEEGLSYTHIASTTENSEFLKKLLHNGSDVNAVFKGSSINWRGITPGSTPLHFAVVHNNENALNTLLDYNVDIYAKDDNGMTPIHLMVVEDRTDILLNLEDLEDSVVDGVGLSHLHVACLKGHYVGVSNLIENGANVRQRLTTEMITTTGMSRLNDWRGCTPFEIALKKGYQECVDPFVKNDPEFVAESFRNNHDLIRKCLADHGNYYLNLPCLMANAEWQARLKDDFGITALHLACWDSSYNFHEKLVYVNTQVREDSPVWPGWTPFHVFLSSAESHFARVREDSPVWPGWPVRVFLSRAGSHFWDGAIDRLVEAGIDVLLANVDGETALHVAYKYYCKERRSKLYSLINTLLHTQSNFSVNPTSIDGTTHFHIACAVANADVVGKFLRRGLVDVNRPIDFFHETEAGQTPLHLAASASIEDIERTSMRLKTVDLLLKYGADVHAENGCGNTALHECAREKYVDVFERIAKEGADVNARNVLGNAPIHVFLSENEKYFPEKVIDRLVETGIDVRLPNADGETAVHVAYKRYRRKVKLQSLVNPLLQSQNDFSVNPTSIEGITHFHIACAVGNANVVGKFLQRGLVDVNLPINFSDETDGGQTPLHLAANASTDDSSMRLRTVDLLLKNGADVHAENSCGNTALHECARGKFIDAFERIAKEGADVNVKNILGHTPLKYFLSKQKISIEEMKLLLRLGCHFSAYNPVTKEGYLARAFCSIPREEIENLTVAMKDYPLSLYDVNDQNRTIIHKIIACVSEMDEKYVALIAELSRIGYDVDDLDGLGLTPLHLSVNTQNVQGIVALLAAGADVNLTDARGKTAFDYCLQGCYKCRGIANDKQHFTLYDDMRGERGNGTPCRCIQIHQLLANHVRKLLYIGLDVSENNLDCLNKTIDRYSVARLPGIFFEELKVVNKVTIGSHKFPLLQLLSENDAVIDYQMMPFAKRSSIDNFFRSNEIHNFRMKFRETAGIIQLQYRKAVARKYLMEEAKNSIIILSGIWLGDLCCQVILQTLKSSELRNLIAATSNEENTVS